MTDDDHPKRVSKHLRSLEKQHAEMLRIISATQPDFGRHSSFLDVITKSVAASIAESNRHSDSLLAQLRHAAGITGANASSLLESSAALTSAFGIGDRLKSLQPYNELVAQLAKFSAPSSIPGLLSSWNTTAISESASKWHTAGVSDEITRVIERHARLSTDLSEHLSEIHRACGAIDALHRTQTAFPAAISPATMDSLNRLGTLGAAFSSLTPATALLAEVEPSARTSGLLWRSDQSDRFNAGFLMPTQKGAPPPMSRHVEIDVTVVCSICNAQMFSSGASGTWCSDAKVEVRIAMIPLCLECRKRIYDDPELIFELAYDEPSPKLELIDGGLDDGSTSSPTSRDHLRIVRSDDDE